MCLVVFQRCRRKGNMSRRIGGSHSIEDRQSPFDFDSCRRIHFMGRLGGNDMRQLESFALRQIPTCFGHDIGSLFLLVDFAAIGDGW